MEETKEKLEKWVTELSQETLKNLEDTLSVVIPVSEIAGSNPLGLSSVPITDFRFPEKGVNEESALKLLEAIGWKIGTERMAIGDNRVVLNLEAVRLMKYTRKLLQKIPTGQAVQERVINRRKDGEYYYKEKLLELDRNSLYFHILEYLYDVTDAKATYQAIENHLISRKFGTSGESDQQSERIRNAIKVYEKNKKFPQKINNTPVFKVIRGWGICLNNPEI